jgi:CRISPR/Cas system-associated endonuclease Cas1
MGRQVKVVNVLVDTFGNYVVMNRGCIVLRDKEIVEKRYPLFEEEIGEVVLTSGNMVSTGALSAMGFWGIDVVIATRNGRPILKFNPTTTKNLEISNNFAQKHLSQNDLLLLRCSL